MPVIMLSFVFVPALLTSLEVDETTKIVVVDYTDLIYESLATKLATLKLTDGSDKYIIDRMTADSDEFETLKESLKQRITNGKIDGFIHIPPAVLDSGAFEYYARNVGNFEINREIRNSVNDIIIQHRIRESGLEPTLVNTLTRRIQLRTVKIKKGTEEAESSFIEEYFATFAFVLILYVTILIYGAAIMRGVLQEKTSRVIEIMLSTANSFQLMVGKIIGLGSVGLTQYVIWSLFGSLLLTYGAVLNPTASSMPAFSVGLFIYFILFFLLGYFLFATIYATIGAMTNSDQEAQQLSMPVVLLIIIPILVFAFIVKNPDSTTAVVLSMIPFFSPILMFARINISSPSFVEIGSAILILVLTILSLMYVAARIYRIGILMYGKRPNLPELMRWIRTK
jgi:ABC-2 type transport system permease protein